MTDRPPVSGEPSTEAGRALIRRASTFSRGKHQSITLPVGEWERTILAIEAEAAQGAASLDPEKRYWEGFEDGKRFAAASEGAAPRAEGLQVRSWTFDEEHTHNGSGEAGHD